MWSTLSRRLVVGAEADALRADLVRRGGSEIASRLGWLNQTKYCLAHPFQATAGEPIGLALVWTPSGFGGSYRIKII